MDELELINCREQNQIKLEFEQHLVDSGVSVETALVHRTARQVVRGELTLTEAKSWLRWKGRRRSTGLSR